jgi:hypothetical protein
MKNVISVILIWVALSSCNHALYSPIYSQNFKKVLSDSALTISPFYSYQELVSNDEHDSKFWVFSKDSLKFFQLFDTELKSFFSKSKKNVFGSPSNLNYAEVDSSLALLSRGAVDSFETYINKILDYKSHDNNIAILNVEFKMNKERGTSGLGPVGDFSPFGSYYIHFFAMKNNKLISYKSMLRRASFFNRFYTSKRSRNAIKAFFR